MTAKELNEKRTALIQAVQKLTSASRAVAESSAISLARFPTDKERQMQAKLDITVYDANERMLTDVVHLINGHWPRTEDKTP
jgi:hypothetical protein